MKKIIILLIFIVFVLILSGCQNDIFTYDNPGKIIITVTNSDIALSDIRVSTEDDDAEIEKANGKITVNVSKLLRTVVTVSSDGYIAKTVLVKSTDFNNEGVFETKVTLEENYISLELTVITDAPSEEIDILSDDILSQSNKGSVYNIKLKNEGTPQLVVSAGEGFGTNTITLTATEIEKRVSSRTIMLIPSSHVLIEMKGLDNLQPNLYTQPSRDYDEYRKGNTIFYSVPKNCDVTISVMNMTNWQHYGSLELSQELLSGSTYLSFTPSDLYFNVKFKVSPYDLNKTYNNVVYAIATKNGDQFTYYDHGENYNEINNYGDFSQSEEYYIFLMGDDGKIRYKKMDVASAEYNVMQGARYLEIAFSENDPVLPQKVHLTDITGVCTDFAGTKLYESYIGGTQICQVASGNLIDINPINYFSNIAANEYPAGCNLLTPQLFDSSEDYVNFLLTGIYELRFVSTVDIYVHIDSVTSYKDDSVFDSVFALNYVFDENNTAFVQNFNFSQNFMVKIAGQSDRFLINEMENYENLTVDEFGDFHVTIKFD